MDENTQLMAPAGNGEKRAISLLQPRTLGEAVELAKIMAASEMVPKEYVGKPGDILVAVQHGAELGMPALQSLQSICVINRRPCLWGDAVLALVRNSGKLQFIMERTASESWEVKQGSCTVQRVGDPEPVTRTFSYAEAENAGLVARAKGQGGNGTWITYPGRMLQMRARSWALRDVFPDVLKGLRVREEEEDVPKDAEVIGISSVDVLKRLRERETAPKPSNPPPAANPAAEPEKGGGTVPPATESAAGTMKQVIGQAVDLREAAKGKTDKGSWSLWVFKVEGVELSTLEGTMVDAIVEATKNGKFVAVDYETTPDKKGTLRNRVAGLEVVDAP